MASSFLKEIQSYIGLERDADYKSLIANALNISESGAYKKINNITKLTIEEAEKICNYLDIQLDLKIDRKGSQSYSYRFMCDDLVVMPSSYEQWASNVYNHSILLDRYRQKYTVYSYQSEISYFHYLDLNYLTYFKLFSWNRTGWDIPSTRRYDQSSFTNNGTLNILLSKIKEHYISYKSIDIWHVDFLDSMFSQIIYYNDLKIFKTREDIDNIINDLEKLIRKIENQTTDGCKYQLGTKCNNNNLDIYLNHTHTSSSTMYINAENFKLTYKSFLHPNYLRTTDTHVCAYTEKWMHRAISQSTLISESGEVTRNNFLLSLNRKFRDFKNQITT